MDKLSPNTQRLVWVLVAIGCVLLACLPQFTKAELVLTHLSTLIIGGVMVTKPGDAPAPLVDIIKRVAASLSPPPPSTSDVHSDP